MGETKNPIKNRQIEGKNKVFGIKVENLSKKYILEEIKKFLKKSRGIFHIVSLNPEILTIAREDEEFKKLLTKAQIRIVDGVGVVLAARLLGFGKINRTAGVDLFQELLSWAGKKSLKILLVGGKGNLAESIAECYQKEFPKARFVGIEGIKNIKKVLEKEEREIFSIVSYLKPHFVFVAFGSPFQEKWIYKHRQKFEGVVVMGVGGGFDYLDGRVPRPPLFLRKLGFEWLWRLILQPWRAKRQVRLIKFAFLVLKMAWEKRFKGKF